MALVGTGNLMAVDKKKKTTDTTSAVTQPDKNTQADTATKADKPKYDNFIDNNGNGIDDRKENLKQKKSSPKPQKDQKPDTTKVK